MRLACALTAVTMPAPAWSADPVEARVAVKLFQFQPDTLSVAAGTPIVWHNGDEIGHAVTPGTPERPEGWTGGELPELGTRLRVVLERPGLYSYHCGRHPSMQGAIRVTPKGDER